jgi:hypothetical protein
MPEPTKKVYMVVAQDRADNWHILGIYEDWADAYARKAAEVAKGPGEVKILWCKEICRD